MPLKKNYCHHVYSLPLSFPASFPYLLGEGGGRLQDGVGGVPKAFEDL